MSDQTEAEFAWHETNGPVIDDERYMPVTTARALSALAPVQPDPLRAGVEALARTADANGCGGWADDLRALLAETADPS
jgi:hypothetical protein